MFHATVETDIGDRLKVLRFDGTFAGKAILSMIMGISQHCLAEADESAEMQKWFSELEIRAGVSICELATILTNGFYSGDWEFNEDEYVWFQKRSTQMQLTEDEFVTGVRQVRQKWVDAKLLATNVNRLINLLIEYQPEPTWWYEPRQSEAGLIALSQTLATGLVRGAEQVRIRFE